MTIKKLHFFIREKKYCKKSEFFNCLKSAISTEKNLIHVDWLIILKNIWHQKIYRLLSNIFWPLTVSEKWTSEVLSQVYPAG